MHRVGADPGCVVQLVAGLVDRPELGFGGLWTHLAVADEPEREATAEQLRCFDAVRESLRASGLAPPRRLHAANTAGAIAWPSARFDMVRCGIGLYGYSPSRAVAPMLASEVVAAGWEDGLRPALSWVARVSMVRELDAGERVSYGLRQPLPARSLVATVPLGYADGIPRSYFTGGGVVLVNGRRRPLAGTVTMDQILVDCGDDSRVTAGDEVVLIGEQGDERLTADDWADVLGTISYEVVTRIGPRVRRVYHGGFAPAPGAGAAGNGPGEAGPDR
jgi:alanine racemase